MNLNTIKSVGVINGPGSFTGVRTGVIIANTIAYALKIPIYATDTLTAQIPVHNNPKNPTFSTLPASHTEHYVAKYKNGKIIGKIEIVNNQDIDAQLLMSNVHPKVRLKNLLQMILDNKIRPAKQALPLYIKKPNITLSRIKTRTCLRRQV